MEKSNPPITTVMSKVRKISLNRVGSLAPSPELAGRLLSIPSLEEFSIHGVYHWYATNAQRHFKWTTSNITSLTFFRSCTSYHFLSNLPYTLKSLHYEAARQYRFDARAFGENIAHLKDRLEVLSILREACDPNIYYSTSTDNLLPIASLWSFKKLHTLKVFAPFLVRHFSNRSAPTVIENFSKRFPTSLDHLTLMGCQRSIFTVVPALLQGGKSVSLSTIVISFSAYCLSVEGVLLEREARTQRLSLEMRASTMNVGLEWKIDGEFQIWPTLFAQPVQTAASSPVKTALEF